MQDLQTIGWSKGHQMFSYEIHKDDGLIMLTETGKTTFDDYQTVLPKFFADARSHGIRKVLVESHEFEGWDSRQTESVAFMAWTEARSMFDRFALITHDSAKSEVARFLEFFQNAGKDVRVFPPAQYESALEWLKHNGTTNE